MDLNQLKYFEVIAKYQNMSRAQEILHIAQPALSAGLNRLEKQLGVPLFTRQKGRLYLNAYGEIFLKYVTAINANYAEALKEIETLKKASENSLNIAILDTGFSMNIIPYFTLIYPDVNVSSRIVRRDPDQEIQLDEFDIIITPLPETFADMEYIPLLENELLLAVPPSHRLYQRDTVKLSDLESEHLYSVGSGRHLPKYVKGLLVQAGVTPQSFDYCVASDLALILKSRRAVSVIPPSIRRTAGSHSDIRFIHFDPPIFRTTGLAYKTTRKRSDAAKKFCDFAYSYSQNPSIELDFQ